MEVVNSDRCTALLGIVSGPQFKREAPFLSCCPFAGIIGYTKGVLICAGVNNEAAAYLEKGSFHPDAELTDRPFCSSRLGQPPEPKCVMLRNIEWNATAVVGDTESCGINVQGHV